MPTTSQRFEMPKPVRRKVRRLRWLVRFYVLLAGIAAIAIILGLAFWLGLAIDWTFEPTPTTRRVMWLATGFASLLVAYRYLLAPLGTKLSNTSLALLLERNFPDLQQSVITTVEADGKSAKLPEINASLLDQTSESAAQRLRSKQLHDLFQFKPLLQKLAAAAALVASVVALAMLQGEVFSFWLDRMQLSEQPWPRQVQLRVQGFEPIDGVLTVNVARDDDFDLQVLASLLDEHLAPEQVEIRYRQSDGRRGRFPLTKVGNAVPGRDDAQQFRYEFKKVAADLDFDLVGGDDRLRNLRLRVVERPQIVRMLVECQFPAYLDRTPQTIPVSGRVELPEGTKVTCRLESNKPLVSVQIHDPAQQTDFDAQLNPENQHEASIQIDLAREDRVLLVKMLDSDGVENRDPYRVTFSSLLDLPPEVSVQLRGIGSAITPQATIPLVGTVEDEYRLAEAWFEHQIDKSKPEQRALSAAVKGRAELRDFENFDLAIVDPATNRPLVQLQPGQQLTLSLKASDAYDLDEQGHVGSSQRFVLDVVTESQLRALLEKKELTLRQRFESIYEKMLGTRELLDRIAAKDVVSDQAGANRERQRDRLRVTGALQNVVQLSYETLGVADGIESIVGELVNNRVDSEELTERLLTGIADPLREIGNELMPQLEQQLQRLQSSYASGVTSREQQLTASKLQGDAVLDAMKNVLDRMLELESYNELVELLRGIVADQQEIQKETKQQRKQKLRSLLEE